MRGDPHRTALVSHFEVVEREERHEHDDGRCPSCGVVMYVLEVERGEILCGDCDLALERELAVRAIRAPRDE